MASVAEEKRFYHHALLFLRETFPEKTGKLDDEALKAKLDEGCEAALDFGFTKETDVMGFVDWLWRAGKPEDITNNKAYAQILGNSNITPANKIDMLRDCLCSMQILGTDDND